MTGSRLSFGTWLATEGGRKCPQCGRYAREKDLGDLSYFFESPQGRGHVSMFGHLPGKGCNKSQRAKTRRRA